MSSPIFVAAIAGIIASGAHGGKTSNEPSWLPFECRDWQDGRRECRPVTKSPEKSFPCVETFKFKDITTKEMWWYCKGIGNVSKKVAEELNKEIMKGGD